MINILLCTALTFTPSNDSIIYCGADEVVVMKLSDSSVSWRWRASDSPGIPADAHRWFRSTDECKPTDDAILIASSSGGVALVRRKDKRCMFLAHATNAHSACVVSRNLIAVAASTGGDKLLLYSLENHAKQQKPIDDLELNGAHGAVWDEERNCLWALGTDRLLMINVDTSRDSAKLVIQREVNLPTRGGHDLSPTGQERFLFVTTNTNVYRFNKDSMTFELDDQLGHEKKVKSVSQNPKTGEVVFHKGTSSTWWSDTIRFIGKRSATVLPNQRIYKVRWDR